MNITYYISPAGTLTTADEPTAAAVIYHGPGDWYVRVGSDGLQRDCAILTGNVSPDLIRRRAAPYIADGLTTEAAVERVCAIVMADV
jgi:hypothetical protein